MIGSLIAETTGASSEETLLAVTVVILVGPFLARRLRLPGTIGLVLGGAAIGANGLGWLEEGQLDGLGDIGLLYLMFSAGLELDMAMFRRYRTAALTFGVATFLAPFVIGMIVGGLLDYTRAAAILLGSVWASHTLVGLPDVKRLGLSGNRAVAITVSATALTDTLALVVLAVVTSGAADDPDGRPMVRLAVGLVVLAVACLLVIPWVGSWVFRTAARERTSRLVFLLGAFSGAALIAEGFGIEGLVGAFLAGLGANRLVPSGGALMERVEFFGSALFVPAFLVFVGTQLDPAALGSWETIGLAAAYLAIVVVGKVLAAAFSGWRERFRLEEIGLMASLSVGQAAATLAATLVGQSVGIFDDSVVNGVLVAVMVTILLSSLGTVFFGRRIEPERSVLRPISSTVLVPVDGAAGEQRRLLEELATFVGPAGGRVVPVRVLVGGTGEAGASARHELEAVESIVSAVGADVEGVLRVDASTADGVLHSVTEHDATLLVLPWREADPLTARLFGSEIEEIGRRSPIPVVTGRLHETELTRVVLVADRGPGSVVADLAVAAQFIDQLVASHRDLAVRVLVDDPDVLEGLALARRAEVEVVQGVRSDWIDRVSPRDLVIVPPVVARHGDSSPTGWFDAGLSVLVAAAPYRLDLTGARPDAGNTTGFLGLQRI